MAKADLQRVPLAEALRDLHLRGATGDLAVQRFGVEKIIHLREGRVNGYSAESSERALADAVVKWGLLSEPELEGVRSLGNDRPLVELLENSGVVEPDEVLDLLRRLVRESVLELFQWDEGEIEFRKGEPSTKEELDEPLETPDLILEGIRRMKAFGAVRERLLWANPVLKVETEPPVAMDDLHVHPQEGYLFSVVDGTTDIKQVLTLSSLGEDETLRLIYAFLVLGLLRSADMPSGKEEVSFTIRRFGEERERAAERIEDTVMKLRAINERLGEMTDLQIFGLEEDAGPEEINRVYQELIKKYRPDRFPAEVLKQCRREIELINARIGTAYLSLTGEQMDRVSGARSTGKGRGMRSREEIEAAQKEAAEGARELVRLAKDAESRRDFHTAMQYAQQATRREPDNPDHHAYLAHILQKNPAWTKRAEASLKEAIELDPDNADLHWDLAQLYIKGKHKGGARRELNKVAELDPDRQGAVKKLLKKLK